MLFIARGVVITQYWFSRKGWKLVAKKLVQFCEFGFSFFLQPELLIDEVDPFLSFLRPFYLIFLELLYCQVVSLSLLVDAIFGKS